jgi:hypothetical protein
VGFFRLRREPGPLFVLLIGLGYSIPPFLNSLFAVWFVRRYVYPALAWWSPIMALGLLAIAGTCRGRGRILIGGLAVLLAGLLGYELYRGLQSPPLTIKDAGIWIRENGPSRSVLLAVDRRIEHYAGTFGHAPDQTDEGLRQQVRTLRPDFIVTVANNRETPQYRETVSKLHDLVQVFPKSPRGDEVRIYRVRIPE